MTFTLYKGPAVACTYCVYAMSMSPEARGRCMDRPRAKYVIDTPNGPREVCEMHAQRGKPDRNRRRVCASRDTGRR